MEAWTFAHRVQAQALAIFRLPHDSLHGPQHWKRVNAIGQKIAENVERVDPKVVCAFAFLHDCCRVDEGQDEEHGERAAFQIRKMDWLDLSHAQLRLLDAAISQHSKGFVIEEQPTIAACWDADRLDLFRLHITPDPELLSLPYSRQLLENYLSKQPAQEEGHDSTATKH